MNDGLKSRARWTMVVATREAKVGILRNSLVIRPPLLSSGRCVAVVTESAAGNPCPHMS